MQKTGKLELTWVGKYDEKIVEPRILVEDKSKSYGDPNSKNMLIHGDNLIALQALQQDYAGKVKCIYIDPPYNTGSAFSHYDDDLEHSTWLSLMRSRLVLLHRLLNDDGTIWISIDDDEGHYLKVMCDEIFGRKNFVNTIVWEKKYAPQGNAQWFTDSHDFILVYAKNKNNWVPNMLPRSDSMNSKYKNPDNDPKGLWRPDNATISLSGGQRGAQYARTGVSENIYELKAPNGKTYFPPQGRCWYYPEARMMEAISEGKIFFGKDGKGAPQLKRYLSEVKQGATAMTIWKREEVGDNQDAKREVRVFNSESVFATPKPERLIERIILIASNPGDIVLDSFLGSGTTSAVAQKMGRSWIGVEMGDHVYTHCKVRIDAVIDGEQGGISNAVGWNGGGGYHFYELAPSLLIRNDKLPVYQINPEYTFEMICEAICKLEGFRYKPDGNFHGYSSEKRFIHITKEFVNAEYIMSVATTLGEDQSLLIYGTKIQSDLRLPDNIEVKKIPKDLLEKCDFESEVR